MVSMEGRRNRGGPVGHHEGGPKKGVAAPVTQASNGAAVREKEVRNAELTMRGCGFITSSSLPHRGQAMMTNHDPDPFM
jgi:hypothetical protein